MSQARGRLIVRGLLSTCALALVLLPVRPGSAQLEVHVGPDQGHGWSINDDRRLEFLLESLVARPPYRPDR